MEVLDDLYREKQCIIMSKINIVDHHKVHVHRQGTTQNNVPPHLFSIRGDTFAEGPLGQNNLEPSLFIGAISCSCALSSLELEYLISFIVTVHN